MKKWMLLSLLSFSILVIACNKSDDPEPEMDPCENMTSDTYTNAIKAIIDNSCAISGCHDGSQAIPDFRTYSEVKARSANIRSRVVGKTMPPSGALSSTVIQQIDCWVKNGAPE